MALLAHTKLHFIVPDSWPLNSPDLNPVDNSLVCRAGTCLIWSGAWLLVCSIMSSTRQSTSGMDWLRTCVRTDRRLFEYLLW